MTSRIVLRHLAFAILFLAPTASAQYMYLDSNGDGVHTAADKLHPVNATSVDIWFDTAHNRDGSATSCSTDPATPLAMFSYLVNLQASHGTVSYSSYTNHLSGFTLVAPPPSSTETEFTSGFFAIGPTSSLPPGKYLLGSLTITVASGFPSVEIVPYLTIAPADPTLFGTPCEENEDQTNSAILGRDWFDVDGLARPGRGSATAARAPLAVHGSLAFTTERDGPARVRLFDVRGRMVRTVLDTPHLVAGAHSVRFDGRDSRGARLSSGIYYYLVESASGWSRGRVALVK